MSLFSRLTAALAMSVVGCAFVSFVAIVEGAETANKCESLLKNAKFGIEWIQNTSRNGKYAPGQWVEVQVPSNAESLAPERDTTDQANLLARIIEKTGRGTYTIESFGKDSRFSKSRQTRVKSSELSPIEAPATEKNFDKILRPFLSISLEFKEGDAIVIRDKTSGTVEEGSVVRVNGSKAIIRLNSSGSREHVIKLSELTKPVGPQWAASFSGEFPFWFDRTFRIQGALRDFFDGARKLTSLNDFRDLPNRRKAAVVAEYIDRFFAPDHRSAYPLTLVNPEELVCTGAAVCNHKALFAANILTESGFNAEIQYGFSDIYKEGHAWAVVEMPGPKKRNTIYIIDPGQFDEVLTVAEADKQAEKHPQSLSGQFYRSKGRRTIKLNHHR